jgi:hypothetical protein
MRTVGLAQSFPTLSTALTAHKRISFKASGPGVGLRRTEKGPVTYPEDSAVVRAWRAGSRGSKKARPMAKMPRCGIQKSPSLVCTARGPTSPRSWSPILAVLDSIAQIRTGLMMNLWRLGTRPASPRCPARSTGPAAFPIGLSTASLRHRGSGNTPPIAFIRRVAGVAVKESRQSR